MSVLNAKLNAVSEATTTIRERALQLRQLQRATERLGFSELSSELGDLAEDLVSESKGIDKAVGVLVSEFMSEVTKRKGPVDAVSAAAGHAV